jgi:hypothetical protein
MEQRLPRRAQIPPTDGMPAPDRSGLDERQAAMIAARDARMEQFETQRAAWLAERARATRDRQRANAEQARRIRAAWLERRR